MEFSAEEILEFKQEALDLLDNAEKDLLALERGAEFSKYYDSIFRVFHSIKGGAGMLSLQKLQEHMHQLETHYQQFKSNASLPSAVTSYFLRGVDVAKQILDGNDVAFDYALPPAEKAPAPESKVTVLDATEARSGGSGFEPSARVMVIDDEPEIVELLVELLKAAKFDAVGFTAASEAFQSLKRYRPDVVLTDYRMPECTGYDVLKTVAQFDSDLPVIYLSGHLSKDVILEALRMGVFGALEKPFSNTAVVSTCTNAARHYQLVKLLHNTISFVYYQYSDLDNYLKSVGAKEIRDTMQKQFKLLIETKRKLKLMRSSVAS